jgi:predicted permease
VGTLRVLARLRPGATPAQAAAEATAAARSVERPLAATLLFGEGGPVEVRVAPLAERLTEDVRPALVVFSAGMLLVLLVSCANVANLFLSQSAGRSRELAVRAALGAGRLRLVRQLLTESLVVSLAGGACGALVAWMLVAALPALAPADFPRLRDVRVDAVFFAIALAGSTLVGLSAGIVPALRGSARAPASPLHGGDRRATDWRAGRLRSLLLVTEAALAVMLLVGAGLLGRSFVSLARVDPGYEPDRVLVGTVHLTGAAAEAGRGPAAVARILERVRALSGVAAAGAGTMTPLGDSIGISMLTLAGPPGPDGQLPRARALSTTVTPGYAEALGLRLRGGRLFRDGDGALETRPFIVNEAFVRTYLDDGQPVVGRRYENRFGLAAIEIVGIVGDALHGGFDAEFEPQIYFPQASDAGFRQTTLVVRTSDHPERIVPALRSIVADAEAGAALEAVAPLGARVAASMSQPRFAASVLGAFAALAAGLAATGLYGVLSFHVSRRRREIGIRAALGADRARILRLVLRQGMGVTAAGLALGLAASALGSRALEGMLFGVSRLDGWSFGAAAGLLALVAAAASLVPARRAAGVDPAEALRAE